MSKLPVISSREIIKILRSIGFEDAPKRGKGSHAALIKKTIDTTKLVIIRNVSMKMRHYFQEITVAPYQEKGVY